MQHLKIRLVKNPTVPCTKEVKIVKLFGKA